MLMAGNSNRNSKCSNGNCNNNSGGSSDEMEKVSWGEDGPPKDLCGERNCFAYEDGQCICLNDTEFGTGTCPFFKTKEEYRAGCAAAGDDFLSANAGLMDEIAELNDRADRIERGEIDPITGGEDDGDGWDDSRFDKEGTDCGGS